MSYSFLLKYIIIGDSGVGKSCLLLQYTDRKYREKHEVTIGVEFGAKTLKVKENSIKLQIWDTAGQQSFKAITRGYYRNAIGAVICYDVTSKQSFNHITKWLDQAQANGSSCLSFILVGNKIDKQQERKVTFQQGLAFAKQNNIPFLQTSAQNGVNVDQIFTILTETILTKIEQNKFKIQNHPGIKIGSQKYKLIRELGNQGQENFLIGKTNNEKSKCCK